MRINLVLCTFFIQCFLMFTVLTISAINYCSPKFCNGSKQHTLCRFQSPVPSTSCIEYDRGIKSDEQRQALLDKINSRRDKIASGDVRSYPAAENMVKLVWNDELEKSAQRWADQCIGQNSADLEDICRDLGNIPVGQTIASVYGEAPGLSPLSLVDVWYMELLNANSSVVPRYRPSVEKGFSHYDYFTQLVWARSSEVGCGSVKFKEQLDTQSGKNRTVHRLVCNFAPGGNVLDQPVYEEGPPCSRCPGGGSSDSTFTSLCSVIVTPTITSQEPESVSEQSVEEYSQSNETSLKKEVPDSKQYDLNEKDENSTVFDYFSEVYDFTRQPVTTVTHKSLNPCKDAIAVDEFLELLKKKLTTDPIFKDILSTKNPTLAGNVDPSFTDPSVAAFVSRIYSKKEPTTTTKVTDKEYVNSTLLVDLVEAVIFRSGGKTYSTEEMKETSQSLSEINPVKIQAELAEVKLNHDFTGHYFFPEDSSEDSIQETSDSYYDTSSLPVSDVIVEIESLKRDKVTNDFLDEIIDFDTGVEESTTTINTFDDVSLYTIGQKAMKKFLEELGEKVAK